MFSLTISLSLEWLALLGLGIIFEHPTPTNYFPNLGFLDECDLEEVTLPLEEYPSMRDFFVRRLKEGSRPIDPDPQCLVTDKPCGWYCHEIWGVKRTWCHD